MTSCLVFCTKMNFQNWDLLLKKRKKFALVFPSRTDAYLEGSKNTNDLKCIR